MLTSLLAWLGGVTPARAQVTIETLAHLLPTFDDGGVRTMTAWGGRVPSYFVTVQGATDARARGLIPATERLAVGTNWQQLETVDGGRSAILAPRRYPLLDLAGPTIGLPAVAQDFGLRGEGTVVGVVDTGADVTHQALRNPDGTSRIVWLLAFGREPRGVHPELEEQYGCTGDDPCAVFSKADLDDILSSRIFASLPKDPIGHGTHITSLAAGRDEVYPGVAPEADLVIVAAADPDGGVSDARILLGTKFVFDRATESLLPAVVNISLGSNFGAHDGTSALEVGLNDLCSGPGRAIVLAAGNSGHLFEGDGRYPDPWGEHAHVAVVPGSTVEVPVVTPETYDRMSNGTLFVWLTYDAGDDLRVGFAAENGVKTERLEVGGAGAVDSKDFDQDDDYQVVLVHGTASGLDTEVGKNSAVLAVTGTWKSGRVFSLLLEGDTSVHLWASGYGDISPLVTGVGPLFPRASLRGTVSVPGSDPSMITVGSSKNRSEWVSFSGDFVGFEEDDDTRSAFSSAGPNQLGHLKPELIAPGGGVIGAMAREADPRTSLDFVSQFRGAGVCPDNIECFVIDDEHGLASGTSMSSPLVAGAVALLFQRDPDLTMERAKAYLMAGTHATRETPTGSLAGTGELDVVGTLLAQERDMNSRDGHADGAYSRVIWAAEFVHPQVPLLGYLILRDDENAPASLEGSNVEVTVEGEGAVTLEEKTPGLVELSLGAGDGAVGKDLTVRTTVGGQVVGRETLRVERDPHLAKYGYQLSGGTCTMSAAPQTTPRALSLLALFCGAICFSGSLVRRARRPL